jgi:FkbM family methyltransferase
MASKFAKSTVKNADRARRTAQFLLQSPLPPSVKRKVLKTELLLVAQRLRNLQREFGLKKGDIVQTRVLDFEVSAYSLSLLMFLHEQIFRDLEYFFPSETADPFIVDGGSNIGMSILFFKFLYPEATIIGFEPDERAYALLKRNIDSNGLTGVQVHQVALGMEDSTVDFFVDPEEPGALTTSTFRNQMPNKKTTVQQVRLSPFINKKVDLLKLDVEGAEGAVLKDLVSTGAISNIDQMIVEYDHHIDEDRDKLGEFLSQLEESGFGYQISTASRDERSLLTARVSRGHAYQTMVVYAYQKRLTSADRTAEGC